MSTACFKDKTPSPYSLPKVISQYDHLYKEFEDNFNCNIQKGSNKPSVGLALFGLGRAGTFHFPHINGNPRIKLLYIVEEFVQKWDDIREHWKLSDDVKIMQNVDADQIYSDPRVHAVLITSPTQTHEGIIMKSLEAGKRVFCEKPLSDTPESVKRCYDKAKEVGMPLFCGFNKRFDPTYVLLKEKLKSGEIGHVQLLRAVARSPSLPTIDYLKISGGIFQDTTVHDFDLVTYLLGELPIRVQASAHSHIKEFKEINDFDTAVVMLTFASGTVAVIDNSRFSCYGYDQRLEVFGPKGMIEVDNKRPYGEISLEFGLNGRKNLPPYVNFTSRFKEAYKQELEHFLDIVQYGEDSIVKGYQVLAVNKIVEAANTSARTGKTVDLAWNKEEFPAEYA